MFSNTSAELSLNTPSKCIGSVTNDTRNHRFLVGTCALSSNNNTSSSSSSSNNLYLLRYHEEMNELAVDAQLDFGGDTNLNGAGDMDDDYFGGEGNHSNINGSGDSGEIWCLSSCPMDKTLLVCCIGNANKYGNGPSSETALWRIPERAMKEDEIDYYQDGMEDSAAAAASGNTTGGGVGGGGSSNSFDRNYSSDMNERMEKIDILHSQGDTSTGANNTFKGRVSDMRWNPDYLPQNDGTGGSGAHFLTVDHTVNGCPTMTTWDIGSSSVRSINHICISKNESLAAGAIVVPYPPKASWDPHNTNLCAVTAGLNVGIVDIRTGGVVSGLKQCHKFGVTDLDHNPNKPNVLSTCGQDSLVKFWDLRYTSTSSLTSSTSSFDDYNENSRINSPSALTSSWTKQHPLRILRGGHTHWSTRVKYNSFHDQLLLSGGTDGMVNLWRVSSISSAPLLDLGSTADDSIGLGPENDFGIVTSLSGFGDEDDQEKFRAALNGGDEDDASFSGNVYNSKNNNSFSDETDGGNAPDVRVTKMEMREAVYDLAWSAADPW
eukprot:CAMPEP_0203667284 /NCGR_PEP_ID=MMETSP0090-20130426/4156_1 /ASSEMBLY_ACC=CAM_ASM_001088 /TAXON_ID=426623 /ORGANISM="Chaetoceros affinis, Strain CCMP159" /LENGTH=547 /DNA_ID=CAMNT_0050531403 /DNA_START=152 /DNA_END=1792 /DNA_ORIENTATION=-